MNKYLLIPLTLFLGLVLLIFVALWRAADPHEIPSPLINKPAPAFQLPQLHDPSKIISASDMRGKVYVLNFWGSWCPPCRKEAPDLRDFSNGLGGQAAFVGVAIDSPSADARNFIRKAGWRYPIVSRHCCDLANEYGVISFPTTIVVNRRGQVVDRLVGPQTVARLQAELRAVH